MYLCYNAIMKKITKKSSKNLKPLRPTVGQVARIQKEPIGSGFLIYNANGEQVMVAPFSVVDGKLFAPDGTPLTYTLEDGKKREYVITAYLIEDD